MKAQRIPLRAVLLTLIAILLVACRAGQATTPTPPPPATPVVPPTVPATPTREEVEHKEEEEAHEPEEISAHSPMEHMEGHHDVPAEAIALENPVPATELSITAGATIYAQNCAVCHGEKGFGDGPAAAGLETEPADLHAEHVQENSDGAMFWIITHGRPETPMPPWEDVLTEEERWHVVNFLRTFKEE